MPGPFDTTTRYLVQTYPTDWISFLGLAWPGPVEVIDANLSTVSAEVDNVVRVGDSRPWLVHLEFQSSYDATIGQRLARYNTMLHLPHRLPVASVLVLLRASADGPAINGEYRAALPDRQPYLKFSYDVRRIWQEPSTDLLAGALGTLPLMPLGASEPTALPGLLQEMERRYAQESTVAEAARLRVVTYTLLGLRYPREIADQLMPGFQNMRDSSTYQAILDEGRVEGRVEGRIEGERRLLLLVGEGRFGPPSQSMRSRLDAITDAGVLERLAERLLTVESWSELLADLA